MGSNIAAWACRSRRVGATSRLRRRPPTAPPAPRRVRRTPRPGIFDGRKTGRRKQQGRPVHCRVTSATDAFDATASCLPSGLTARRTNVAHVAVLRAVAAFPILLLAVSHSTSSSRAAKKSLFGADSGDGDAAIAACSAVFVDMIYFDRDVMHLRKATQRSPDPPRSPGRSGHRRSGRCSEVCLFRCFLVSSVAGSPRWFHAAHTAAAPSLPALLIRKRSHSPGKGATPRDPARLHKTQLLPLAVASCPRFPASACGVHGSGMSKGGNGFWVRRAEQSA